VALGDIPLAQERVERRLAAIFVADMVGYSRLMEADEAGIIARQKAHREHLIDPAIADHGGRIVKTTGDGLLVEFASVVDAIQCAARAQRAMAAREADVPEDRRIQYRVGINLGDIVIDGDDILGDGVNVAARLQEIAEPGGICISGTAYDAAKAGAEVGFEYLGEQQVKNISEPIRTYRVLLEPEALGKVIGERKRPAKPMGWRLGVVAAAAALVVVVAIVAVRWQPWAPDVEPASVERMALPLPDKPSIAVLPFTNLSGDPEQEYLADGIAENIITTLSQIPDLFVIARNSTFTYKGKPVKVQEVAEDLGVQYVLEGSVQRSGETIRITAQLIDAIRGHHLWSQRYDRRLEDLFAVLDDVTREVVLALQVKLTTVRSGRGTEDLEAWASGTKGRAVFYSFNKDDNAAARVLFEDAVRLDAGYAWAWSMLGATHWADARFGWSESRAASLAKAVELGEKALTLDEHLANAHSLFGLIHLLKREHEQAIASMEKGVALAPNDATRKALLAATLTQVGRSAEAAALLETAMRLNPYHPAWWPLNLGRAYRLAGHHGEAITALERAKERMPGNSLASTELVAAYSEAGRQANAEAEVAYILKIKSDASVRGLAKMLLYKDPKERERVLAALRKAGLPENPPLPLPDKPSIAVLPFANLSGDKEQEYFADGLTEDIITDLSKISGLFVIARNSSFAYKGKQTDVRTIARELGVKYVLEGSVRRAGDAVRINAQLIDTTTGGHLWAERYDGTLADVFGLQDTVTKQIVTALSVKLTAGEQERTVRKETASSEAYDAFLKGWEHYRRRTPEDFGEAVSFFDKAIELDPDYARAYAALAATYWGAFVNNWSYAVPAGEEVAHSQSPRAVRDRARKYLEMAMRDPTPLAHRVASGMHANERRHDEAVAEAERALALDANGAEGSVAMAAALAWAGRAEEAMPYIEQAMRLDPHYPTYYLRVLGLTNFALGRLKDAAARLEETVKRNPEDLNTLLPLSVTYAELGQEQDAKATLGRYLERKGRSIAGGNVPGVRFYMREWPFRDAAVAKRFGSGLIKAGLCCQDEVEEFIDRMRNEGLLE
jgi:adenylate cyclase